MPVAPAPQRLPAVADRLRPLPPVVPARLLGAGTRRAQCLLAKEGGPGRVPQLRHRGLSERQDRLRLSRARHRRGKKVKGRKRHISTNTPGNLPRVSVHAANIHDTTAGPAVFRATLDKHPSIEAFSADEG